MRTGGRITQRPLLLQVKGLTKIILNFGAEKFCAHLYHTLSYTKYLIAHENNCVTIL